MTAVNEARRTARRAANSNALEALTRMGFVGYGLLHLAVAWLAVQLALGRPSQESDQSGAFHTLARQPFGHVLLIVITVGLAAMALWQLLLALVGHRDKRGHSRTAERLASAARTVFYVALAWTAGKVVAGAPTSNAEQQQSATAGVMGHTGGIWLVGLCGLGVTALGVGLIVYGVKRSFEKRLMIGQMRRPVRRTAAVLGTIGYVARGVAFGVVGLLLIDAAVSHNSAKSRGLDAALRTLAGQPFGKLLLALVALGFAAFGVYCFLQARYRKVSA
jgi:hypothetical protein